MENREVLINCGDKVMGLGSEWQEYREKLENNQRREAAREEGSYSDIEGMTLEGLCLEQPQGIPFL